MKGRRLFWRGVLAGMVLCGLAAPSDARTRAQQRPAHHTARHTTDHHAAAKHAAKRPASAERTATRRASSQPAKHPVRAALVAASRDAADKPLILIDAGHGGIDSGAIGTAGTLEKTVTLAAARELRRQLVATGRYRVALTRDRDTYVSLSRRVAMIRASAPALFISIHADSSHDHGVSGASIYVRSNDGEAVATLSGGAPLAVAAPVGAPALQDMLIDSLTDDVRLTADPAREARLHVLGVSVVPSVLLEMGFLSNRKDEARLRQPKQRAMIAAAIRDAVDAYISARHHGPRSRV